MGTRVLTRCAARSPPAPAGGLVATALLGGAGAGQSLASPSSKRAPARPLYPSHREAGQQLFVINLCQCFAPAPRSVTVKASALGVTHRGWGDAWRERASSAGAVSGHRPTWQGASRAQPCCRGSGSSPGSVN